jgi:hypothetical protein
MEIHALRVSVTEQDLNDLARRHLADQPVEELRVSITPEGVTVQGEYPLFVPVRFETLWQPTIQDRHVYLRLVKFRALGMPVNVLKGFVMNAFSTLARKEPWVHVQEDSVRLDVEAMLAQEGLTARVNLARIYCESGVFVLEAGANPAAVTS